MYEKLSILMKFRDELKKRIFIDVSSCELSFLKIPPIDPNARRDMLLVDQFVLMKSLMNPWVLMSL